MSSSLKFKKYFLIKKKKKKNFNTNIYSITGDFNLIATTGGFLFPKQLESFRKLVSKKRKRLGFFNFKIKPFLPLTKKPNEVRMGKGKGAVYTTIFPIKKNQIICSLSGITEKQAKLIFNSSIFKLPITTKIYFIKK